MCTTLLLQGASGPLVAYNEDSVFPGGMLFTNLRGVKKRALVPSAPPLTWASRHGSVIFSQGGKEFPTSGVNELGLVVTQMTLREARYPAREGAPCIGELQIIQHLLDTCATVNDCLGRFAAVNVVRVALAVHYFVADAAGGCAVIEHSADGIRAYDGASLPVAAATNGPYARGVSCLALGSGEAEESDRYAANSFQRFREAARWLRRRADTQTAHDALRATLREDTVRSIVYDVGARALSFATKSNPSPRALALADVDFAGVTSAAGHACALSAADARPLKDALVPYSTELNYGLVRSFAEDEGTKLLYGVRLSEDDMRAYARYPESCGPAW